MLKRFDTLFDDRYDIFFNSFAQLLLVRIPTTENAGQEVVVLVQCDGYAFPRLFGEAITFLFVIVGIIANSHDGIVLSATFCINIH